MSHSMPGYFDIVPLCVSRYHHNACKCLGRLIYFIQICLGRIDRKIEFPPPNEDARLDILKIHSRKMNLTRGINLKKIAELMPGASGAEVKGVCTEAGMYALRERRVHVTQEDFEMAVAKIMQKDSEKNMSIKKLFK